MTKFTLADLEIRVRERAKASAAESYTRALIDKGADLLYHLLVLLEARGVTLDEVEAELGRRTVQSGHEEKASRKAG